MGCASSGTCSASKGCRASGRRDATSRASRLSGCSPRPTRYQISTANKGIAASSGSKVRSAASAAMRLRTAIGCATCTTRSRSGMAKVRHSPSGVCITL